MSVADVNVTKKPVRMSSLRVSLVLFFLTIPCVDMKVVDLVPAGHRRIHLTMAPAKPPTQSKRVASKGKAVTRPTTQPHVHKVTQIASPMPEVIEVGVPPPPIAGPSQASHTPLFKDPIRLGDDDVRKEAPAPSGR